MMEEIETLIKLINSLPTLALWVLIGFWAYKVIVVGSIYGLIRFIVDKIYQVCIKPKEERVNVKLLLDGEVLSNNREALLDQLRRLKGYCHVKNGKWEYQSNHIHDSGVEFLRVALDNEFKRLAEQEKAK